MILDNEEKRRYVADAANAIPTKRDRDPTRHTSIRLTKLHSRATRFDLNATRFQIDLSYTLDEPPEHRAEYLAGELWMERMRHDAVKHKNASLKAELETRKKREILLLKLLKHERKNGHPPGRKRKKTDLADLKRIQSAFANLSREDVVRAVRSARDAR